MANTQPKDGKLTHGNRWPSNPAPVKNDAAEHKKVAGVGTDKEETGTGRC